MSEIVMRQVDGITVLDIPKSAMEISRTSEECGKLLKLVHESLGHGRKNIVLNLSQVGYSSHTALGELVAALTTIRNQGGHLKLSNVPPNFRAGLELTHLLPIFDIHDDEAAAIQSFPPTPKGSMSQIVMRQVDGITVLDVSDSFMQIWRKEDGGQLHKLVTESLDSGHKQIVVNFSQVRYCSHKALGEMNYALKTIRARGGDLKLSNVPPSVRAVLEMTHLIKIYDIYDDEAAAIQSFKSTA
jgi:anti-sigma B factor antagonist